MQPTVKVNSCTFAERAQLEARFIEIENLSRFLFKETALTDNRQKHIF